MEITPLQRIVAQLTESEAPRVWSLLVTAFGELAQELGDQISGALLRQICELIGIKPEAMRVALHRLRKDGWIESKRCGRTSNYGLTVWGRSQCVQASPRIYSRDPIAKQTWFVMTDPTQTQTHDVSNGAWVTPNLLLTSCAPKNTDAFLTLIGANTQVPPWIRSKLCDRDTIARSSELANTLSALQTQLKISPLLNPLDVTVVRILLVHRWRRIVLKAPILPDEVFPETWRGSLCRELMFDVLSTLPKQGLRVLEDAAASPKPHYVRAN